MRTQQPWTAFGSVSRSSTKLPIMSGPGTIMRMIAAIIVLLVVFVTALAPTRPILANPTLLEFRVAYLAYFAAEGCGPGWHWSNKRGWNWGRCVLDWRPR